MTGSVPVLFHSALFDILSVWPVYVLELAIGELPKLCEKISILMQANVLIADWYVAPLFPHI